MIGMGVIDARPQVVARKIEILCSLSSGLNTSGKVWPEVRRAGARRAALTVVALLEKRVELARIGEDPRHFVMANDGLAGGAARSRREVAVVVDPVEGAVARSGHERIEPVHLDQAPE